MCIFVCFLQVNKVKNKLYVIFNNKLSFKIYEDYMKGMRLFILLRNDYSNLFLILNRETRFFICVIVIILRFI